MKQKLLLTLALACGLFVLVGCNDNSAPDPTKDNYGAPMEKKKSPAPPAGAAAAASKGGVGAGE
jgi:hypothetical protein